MLVNSGATLGSNAFAYSQQYQHHNNVLPQLLKNTMNHQPNIHISSGMNTEKTTLNSIHQYGVVSEFQNSFHNTTDEDNSSSSSSVTSFELQPNNFNNGNKVNLMGDMRLLNENFAKMFSANLETYKQHLMNSPRINYRNKVCCTQDNSTTINNKPKNDKVTDDGSLNFINQNNNGILVNRPNHLSIKVQHQQQQTNNNCQTFEQLSSNANNNVVCNNVSPFSYDMIGSPFGGSASFSSSSCGSGRTGDRSTGSNSSLSLENNQQSCLMTLMNNAQSSMRHQTQHVISGGMSRYKTELCRPFEESGECKYGDKCQFAHGMGEMRSLSRHPKYKTDYCRTYHSIGFCPYGARCHFIHNGDEATMINPNVAANNIMINNGKANGPLGGHMNKMRYVAGNNVNSNNNRLLGSRPSLPLINNTNNILHNPLSMMNPNNGAFNNNINNNNALNRHSSLPVALKSEDIEFLRNTLLSALNTNLSPNNNNTEADLNNSSMSATSHLAPQYQTPKTNNLLAYKPGASKKEFVNLDCNTDSGFEDNFSAIFTCSNNNTLQPKLSNLSIGNDTPNTNNKAVLNLLNNSLFVGADTDHHDEVIINFDSAKNLIKSKPMSHTLFCDINNPNHGKQQQPTKFADKYMDDKPKGVFADSCDDTTVSTKPQLSSSKLLSSGSSFNNNNKCEQQLSLLSNPHHSNNLSDESNIQPDKIIQQTIEQTSTTALRLPIFKSFTRSDKS